VKPSTHPCGQSVKPRTLGDFVWPFEKMKILVGFESRLCFLLLVKAPPGGVKLGRKSKKNP